MTGPQEKTTTDEALMVRVAKGDKDDFETLVYRHQHAVLNFCYRFIGDRKEAEDLTQEVFLRVWRAAPTYKPTARFTTWIYRIATNLCINKQKSDRLRKWFISPFTPKEEKERNEPSIQYAENIPSPEDLLLGAERRQQILDALKQLPANQRTVLILKRYEGLSYLEISRVMGRSVSSVDALLVRAKRNLQRKLASHEKKPQVFGE